MIRRGLALIYLTLPLDWPIWELLSLQTRPVIVQRLYRLFSLSRGSGFSWVATSRPVWGHMPRAWRRGVLEDEAGRRPVPSRRDGGRGRRPERATRGPRSSP